MNTSEIIPFLDSLIDMRIKQNKEFVDELLVRISSPSSLHPNEFKVIILNNI